MSLKKPTDKKHMLFLFLLGVSNLISWQMGSLDISAKNERSSFYRSDYDTIKVQAKSFVPFERLRHIHIKQRGNAIAYGLLLDENTELGSFTIYCPKKFLTKVTRARDLEIVPFIEETKIKPLVSSRGKKYEIIIP